MPLEISLSLSPKQASDQKYYLPIAARLAGVGEADVALAQIVKRSVDARKKNIKVNLTVRLFVDDEPEPAPVNFDYPFVGNRPSVVIVGAGPAGLFCALRLIERGFRPLLLERGKAVAERKKDIARINRGETVDPESNYAFGEGGAGTFSDGKLYTRSKKRGDYNKALRTLVFHGADPAILYEAHPHIGTDKLPRVISNIRQTILDCGGEFRFDSRIEDIVLKDGKATGVICSGDKIDGLCVVLATGHSARDIYRLLVKRDIQVEAKPYAMGLRIEHPQGLIDSIQYHMPQRGEYLPAASYSLVAQASGRGVYSFCMCPGGFIVPAMTDNTESVVNGMSPSGRNSDYANSGIVTEVRLEDFDFLRKDYDVLAGLEFQERLERRAREHGGDANRAPAQRVTDFISGKLSCSLPSTSYVPGCTPTDFGQWMPEFMMHSIKEGIAAFGRKMRGFITDQAVVLGVESRTSTPVRIPRDKESLEHITVAGLYPAGEGAGYAGGIISAALDGERIADAIAVKYNKS